MQVERIHNTGKIFTSEKTDKLVRKLKKTDTSSAVDSDSGSNNRDNQEQEKSRKKQAELESKSKEDPVLSEDAASSGGLNITV